MPRKLVKHTSCVDEGASRDNGMWIPELREEDTP
jgi:hypothetical protein